MFHLAWVTTLALSLAALRNRTTIGFATPGGTFFVLGLGFHESGLTDSNRYIRICIKGLAPAYHRLITKSSSDSIQQNTQG